MKVSELSGALLDYWVGRAEGLDVSGLPMVEVRDRFGNWRGYAPSTSWAQGGQIIEHERIKLMPVLPTARIWHASIMRGATVAELQLWRGQAETPLVAAMRAYVASKFGDAVPDDASKETQA